MIDIVRHIQSGLVAYLLGALISLGGAWYAVTVLPVVTRAVRRHFGRGLAFAFALAFVGAWVMYGGSKTGRVNYPYTDVEKRYLFDAGSYVTNDLVYINFTRTILPNAAELFIDYRPLGSTNDADWVTHIATTVGAFSVPTNIPFAGALTNNWIVYTTWTPGPSVQTNGVWHSYWGTDRKLHVHFIPIRTAVRIDDTTIATPKSKENAQ